MGDAPPMCLVFDLDETLGNVWSMRNTVLFFKPFAYLPKRFPVDLPQSKELMEHLQRAYQRFVEICADEERAGTLGAIRPGLLPFFDRVAEGQRTGRIASCMIYSNNSMIELLEFARDILVAATGVRFEGLIHMTHPARKGDTRKTFELIQEVYASETGITPTPQQVWFFDDQEHPALQETLGDHYISVSGYDYVVPMVKQYQILKQALQETEFQTRNNLNDYLDIIRPATPLNRRILLSNAKTLSPFRQLTTIPEGNSESFETVLSQELGVEQRAGKRTCKRRNPRNKRRITKRKR